LKNHGSHAPMISCIESGGGVPFRAVRYRTETLDQFLSFQTDNNDHHIRAVLRFAGRLDLPAIRAAVLKTLQAIPVLGSRYVEHAFRAYWEQMPLGDEAHEFVTLVNSSDTASDEQQFLARIVDFRRGPQLMAQIIRGTDGDILCIVVNHMAFDGASFKRYLVMLGRIYTQIIAGSTGTAESPDATDRGLGAVFRTFAIRDLVQLALRSESHAQRQAPARLPVLEPGRPRAEFVCRRIGPSQFGELLSCARERGVTLNDIVMAAYFQALWEFAQPDDGVLNVACMVDLRRSLEDMDTGAYSNLSSMVLTECRRFGDFSRTLDEAHSAMVHAKSDTPGLSGLPFLALLRRVLPHGIFKSVVKGAVTYPLISITNLGVIPDELDFGTASLVDAYILTALKREPALQLTFSTFRQTLTLSMALFASESGISRSVHILNAVIRHLSVHD
jgi:NRPS condensation-like uncharacterized protein